MYKAQWGVLAAGIAVAAGVFWWVAHPASTPGVLPVHFNKPGDPSGGGSATFSGASTDIETSALCFGLLAVTVVLAGTALLVVKVGQSLDSKTKPRPLEEGPLEEGQVWPPPPNVTPPRL